MTNKDEKQISMTLDSLQQAHSRMSKWKKCKRVLIVQYQCANCGAILHTVTVKLGIKRKKVED